MIVTTPIMESNSSTLNPDELISFLENTFNNIINKRFHCVVAIIKEPDKKDKVIKYFLAKGYEIKIYSDSDYVQFNCLPSEEGTLKQCGYPYNYELCKTCKDDSMGLLIYDDEDIEDIYKHFNVKYDWTRPGKLYQKVDSNDVIAYLIEEKGYRVFYEDGRCVIR